MTDNKQEHPIYEGCEGCCSVDICYNTRCINQEYTDYYDERIEKCPCTVCIFKPMCGEECGPYSKLWEG